MEPHAWLLAMLGPRSSCLWGSGTWERAQRLQVWGGGPVPCTSQQPRESVEVLRAQVRDATGLIKVSGPVNPAVLFKRPERQLPNTCSSEHCTELQAPLPSWYVYISHLDT